MSDSSNRHNLADQLRTLAVQTHWLDIKNGSEQQALDLVADLIAAATAYQSCLAAEIAEFHHESVVYLPWVNPPPNDAA
jgi:hypothetical protein